MIQRVQGELLHTAADSDSGLPSRFPQFSATFVLCVVLLMGWTARGNNDNNNNNDSGDDKDNDDGGCMYESISIL